jgi:hypothetical protein
MEIGCLIYLKNLTSGGKVPSEKIGARWPIESKTIYETFFSLKKKVITDPTGAAV